MSPLLRNARNAVNSVSKISKDRAIPVIHPHLLTNEATVREADFPRFARVLVLVKFLEYAERLRDAWGEPRQGPQFVHSFRANTIYPFRISERAHGTQEDLGPNVGVWFVVDFH